MRRYTLLLCLILLTGTAFPQITGDFREMFLEAESFFLFEEYNEAIPYYEPIHKQYPDNDNINYKIGVCLLNDPYRKDEAMTYLEKASQNITRKYKENSFKEIQAPLEVLFYLGNAYRINGQLDKAIQTYQDFKADADPELYDIQLIDEQIEACNNAKSLQTRPVDFDIENLGDRINTRFSDVNPVVSGDESKIVFIQKQAFFDALAYCEKMEDGWSFPRILMQEMAVDEDAYPTAMNYDGTEMIIYRSDNFIGDLYTSRLVDGFWTPPVRMNENINTKYWESHGSFSRTGDTLYFTSNRKGTFGGLDIYYSVKDAKGEWGPPVNLGPVINTRYNEETPFITENGKTLYFSSYGHYNMGGYDVFYSTKLENGEWSVPVNAGYPINTTDDDVFFLPLHNGTVAYFPRFMEGGFGRTDLYRYEIYSKTHPRKFLIRGILTIDNLETLTKPIRVALIRQQDRDTVAVAFADSKTGKFNFEAPAGEYDIEVSSPEIETSVTRFVIPEGYKEKELALKQAILVTQAAHLIAMNLQDDIKVQDTLIRVSSGDTVDIDLTLERRATLFVDVIRDGESVRKDSFAVERRHFTYLYAPAPGDNLLKFKLIDRRGNLSYKDVHIIHTPAVKTKNPESDTVNTVAGVQGTQMEAGLEDYLQRLTDNSDGEMKNLLSGIELAALGIFSADQLDTYLLEQAAALGIKEEEMSTLLMITPHDEKKATEDLKQDLTDLSGGDLKIVLDNLDLEAEGIESEEELIRWLRDHVDEYNYTRQDVNDLVMTNVQKEYLANYKDELSKLTKNEALAMALSETDLNEVGSLQELYDHLLSGSETYGYNASDVNRMFSLLAQKEDLKNLHENLKLRSKGDLQQVLVTLDTDEKGIDSPVDLINYLRKEAANHDYTEKEVMGLLLDYLEHRDLDEIRKLLIGASSGDLLNMLLNLNTEYNNIRNVDDLYNYLLAQARYHDYTEEDVINLFLNLLKIVEHEPIVKSVPPPPAVVIAPAGRKGWIFLLAAGIVILILIILFGRKRKPGNLEENA